MGEAGLRRSAGASAFVHSDLARRWMIRSELPARYPELIPRHMAAVVHTIAVRLFQSEQHETLLIL